jgi:hypothetical protein
MQPPLSALLGSVMALNGGCIGSLLDPSTGIHRCSFPLCDVTGEEQSNTVTVSALPDHKGDARMIEPFLGSSQLTILPFEQWRKVVLTLIGGESLIKAGKMRLTL